MFTECLIVGVSKAIQWGGSAATTVGGIMIAASTDPAAAPSTATAGYALALTGIASAFGPVVKQWIDAYYKDRSDARGTESLRKDLEAIKATAAAAAERARRAEMEAASARGRLVELEHLPAQIEANTARAKANEGKLEGVVQTLQETGFLAASASGSAIAVFNPSGDRVPRSTVLVVEDSPETVQLLCRLFTAAGYSTSYAVTVEEAMEKVALWPHWVVLDLKVGTGEGEDILRKVKDEHLPVRTAVVTGTPDPARLEGARKLADVVFQKPISGTNFDTLLAMMREIPKPPKLEAAPS